MTSRTGTKNPARERHVRFAEAAVVFVLALGLSVFLGLKIFGGASEEIASATTADATQNTETWHTSLVTDAGPNVPPASEPTPAADKPEIAEETVAEPEAIGADWPPFVTYATAEAAFFEGEYQMASEMFATYCERHPENIWGHYMRGLSLHRAGEIDAAADAFGLALEHKPDHLKSLINLARTELDRDRPDAALAAVEQAVQIAPDNVDARRVLGRVYHELDRNDEAVQAYTRVLQISLDDGWTLNNLGLLYIQREQFHEALAPLARAAQLLPDVAVIQNNLGVALERTGQVELAHDLYVAAIALDPTYTNAEANLVRTEGAMDPEGTEPVDLVALAAGFAVETRAVIAADTP